MDEIRFTMSLRYLLYPFIMIYINLSIFKKCVCISVSTCVCANFHDFPMIIPWQPGDVVSRLHATCNLADYVLGIGAQGRQAPEASSLEPCFRGVRGEQKETQKKTRISPGDIKYVPDGVGWVVYIMVL